MTIAAGDRVKVRSAGGEWLLRRAVSGVEPGDRFPIVMVAREEEWLDAQEAGRDPESVPWPAEEVRPDPQPAPA